MADPFRILVVCTANICRSPLAAALLRQRIAERFPGADDEVEVSSAGVRALVGHPMDQVAEELLEARGGSAPGFAARQVDAALLRGSDLVLVMTREHRAAVVRLAPAALRRTYTLPELARIARARGAGTAAGGPVEAPAGPAAALRALLADAPALRGPTAPADAADDDVDDPYRRPRDEYERAAGRISAAVDEVLAALA